MGSSREGSQLTQLKEVDTTAGAATRAGDVSSGHIVLTGQGRDGAGRIPILYARAVDKADGRPRVYTPFDQLRPEEIVPEALPLMMSMEPDDLSPLDGAIGLILPGGGDIDPVFYGEPRHPRTKNVSRLRDRFELNLLTEALRRDMPIFCICRGFQLLNVKLGGSLDQHLADHPERLEHDRDMPRVEPAHTVRIKEGNMLAAMFEETELPVNSHHHQGLERVAAGLEEVAWAGDGVLEAVVATGYTWVLGVQWHPEVMAPVDHRQAKFFQEFQAATLRYQAARQAA